MLSHRACWKTLCFEAIHLVFCTSRSFNAMRNTRWKWCCYSSDCSLSFSLVSTFILSHSSSCDLIISSARDWMSLEKRGFQMKLKKYTREAESWDVRILVTCKTCSTWVNCTEICKSASQCYPHSRQTREKTPGNSLRHWTEGRDLPSSLYYYWSFFTE